jgi:hypothetical protein
MSARRLIKGKRQGDSMEHKRLVSGSEARLYSCLTPMHWRVLRGELSRLDLRLLRSAGAGGRDRANAAFGTPAQDASTPDYAGVVIGIT